MLASRAGRPRGPGPWRSRSSHLPNTSAATSWLSICALRTARSRRIRRGPQSRIRPSPPEKTPSRPPQRSWHRSRPEAASDSGISPRSPVSAGRPWIRPTVRHAEPIECWRQVAPVSSEGRPARAIRTVAGAGASGRLYQGPAVSVSWDDRVWWTVDPSLTLPRYATRPPPAERPDPLRSASP